MRSEASTVADYLKGLEPGPRREIEKVRKVILANLPKGYVEMMDFGMISYVVPLARYPETYNGHPLSVAGLAAQKRHHSVYLMCVYANEDTRKWFEGAWKAAGKKLNMGKSCVRFSKADDLALDVVGQAIARMPLKAYLERYERSRLKR